MVKFYKDFFISPRQLADNLESSRKIHNPKIPDSDPSELSKQLFKEQKDFNPICFDSVVVFYASNDIALHPSLYCYFKKKF